MTQPSLSIGQLLVDKGFLTSEQLEQTKKEMAAKGQTLRQVIYRLGLVSEKDYLTTISEFTKIPYVNLSSYVIDPEVVKFLPEEFARRYQVVPLFKIGNNLTLGAVEPLDIYALDELKLKTGTEVELILVSESALMKTLDEFYKIKGSIDEISKFVEASYKDENLPSDKVLQLERMVEVSEETPVIKIVNLLLSEAIGQKASDIHIEPEEKGIKVRYRVDGVMYEINTLGKNLQSALNTRIKIISKMDISETRRPQDGQFQIRFESRDVDVRVSSFPTVYGENLVLRLLDKVSLFLGMEKIGFTKELLEKYNFQIKKPYGIILVTGPTGSGKTTTLYATLQSINDNTKNIVTIEDPVEFKLDNVRQSQVNVKAGMTFATGLRAILRQDPDIIMVGEIRDLETAEISVQSALTGHLVFSTLHTNDAPSALTRLEDMGIEPFLISSSVTTVLAQRLVRKICPYCKRPAKIDWPSLSGYKIDPEKMKDLTFFEGQGCNHCHNSGYSGRTALFEMMVVNDEVMSLIMAKAPAYKIKEVIAAKYGYEDLKTFGIKRAAEGLTTLAEVLKVTQME